MGVHSRDYMQYGSRPGLRWSPHRVTWWIIGINAGLALVFMMSWGRHGGLSRFFEEYLVLHPQDVLAKGRIWQLFTAFWLHDPTSLSHVLFNMLALYFFGRFVEEMLGARSFLVLYLLAGLASTILLTVAALVVGSQQGALGASGSVYGVLVFAACLRPRATIYMMFIFPMPMWVGVFVLMVGLEVLQLSSHGLSELSAVGHLAGAAYGWIHFRWVRRGPRPSSSGPGAWISELKRKRQQARVRQDADREADVRERVEQLLGKIQAEGIGALTAEEKDFLQEASKRYR